VFQIYLCRVPNIFFTAVAFRSPHPRAMSMSEDLMRTIHRLEVRPRPNALRPSAVFLFRRRSACRRHLRGVSVIPPGDFNRAVPPPGEVGPLLTFSRPKHAILAGPKLVHGPDKPSWPRPTSPRGRGEGEVRSLLPFPKQFATSSRIHYGLFGSLRALFLPKHDHRTNHPASKF